MTAVGEGTEQPIPSQERVPLVLFSGLGADSRIFVAQKVGFPELVVPRWPVPDRDETLDSYCDRIADQLRPYGKCLVGGASFGGIVALHVAQRIDAYGVVLIGSVRSPAELSHWIRACSPLRRLLPWLPLRAMQWACAPLATDRARCIALRVNAMARQFRDSDPRVVRWSMARILDWKHAPTVPCPFYQIHGGRDFILSPRRVAADAIIPAGGHIISVSHPAEVNAFLRSVVSEAAQASSLGSQGEAPPARNNLTAP